MIIDAHQHFWRLGQFDSAWLDVPEHQPIRRDYSPVHLKAQLKKAGVGRTVLVQTQHDCDETRWMLTLADEHDWIAGVVGWTDLTAPDCVEQLARFQQHRRFVGVRHLTHDETEDDFIVRRDVISGLKVLEQHRVPFDLLLRPQHLRHAPVLAEMLPELPMVIDHLAKPSIKAGLITDWERDLRAASKHENVYCKLSGMVTEAHWSNWTPADLAPYVEIALDAFGPARLMFGSDWPVCELAGSYQQVFDALKECLSSLSKSESRQIYCETAIEFYGLKA